MADVLHVQTAPEPRAEHPALVADDLVITYGAGNAAVSGVSLEVGSGEVVALLGANGAGKTSTLLALAGAKDAASGTVRIDGRATTAPLHRRAREGLALLTEDRCIFGHLTVRENLVLGRGKPADALAHFPELSEHMDRQAGLLSGGQQQMLALGRILAGRPRILLADELSLGLAPLVVKRLLAAVRQAADDGLAVLLVEQHVHLALEIADRVYLMRRGRIAYAGTAAELRANPSLIADLYLEQSR
ncbi:ABC transporter ATP-binding protein [Nocardioides ferulae]|uniref:ABC transporter ATP-binding protein n=1 Tax=Nocardioides ferulae TaxID=2340821 RepID=UPI000EB45679|nr:ABC transporter ATP-binding protein [Nocardioides ferulae]